MLQIFIIIIVMALVAFKLFFIWFQKKSIYRPIAEITETPSDLGIEYEDVRFKTMDGETLNGWFIPAKEPKGSILYCHGNAGNIQHRLYKVRFFYEMGFNFFIFDYRGYGKSSGIPCEKGLYHDATAAFDYLIMRTDVDKSKVIVFGGSLGGPVAAEVCLRRAAAALIIEGSFVSMVLRAYEKYPFLPMNLLITQKFDTQLKLKSLSIPKLIVHGTKDKTIKFSHGKKLYDIAADPKAFISFDGGHNDTVYTISEAFKGELNTFLTAHCILS